jgi:hypothetical protein
LAKVKRSKKCGFYAIFVVFFFFAVLTSFSQISVKTYEVLASDASTVVGVPSVAGFSNVPEFPTDPGGHAAVDSVSMVPAAAVIPDVNGVAAVVGLHA